MCQIHVDTCLSESSQSEEHERDTEDEIADNLALLRVDKDNSDKESRPYKVGDIK